MKRHLSESTQAQIDALDIQPDPTPDYAYIASDPMLRGIFDRFPQMTDQEPT